MTIQGIPVKVIGPGSQNVSGEDRLDYIDMPNAMDKYEQPRIGDPDALAALPAAREALQWLREALATYQLGAEPVLANLDALDVDSRRLVGQILGEGEVADPQFAQHQVLGRARLAVAPQLSLCRMTR